MIDRIRIELNPVWISTASDGFRHQVYNGHRWSLDNVSHDDVAKLTLLLKGVGSLKVNLEAFPASITVSPYAVLESNVDRVRRILVSVFGDSHQ